MAERILRAPTVAGVKQGDNVTLYPDRDPNASAPIKNAT